MKLCKACGCEKDTTEFHKDKSKKDGLNAYCKSCQIARQKEYLSRPPRHVAPSGYKRCQRCKEEKPTEDFSYLASTYDNLDRRCKACAASLHDTWRRKNLAYAAADQKKRRGANPERWRDYKRKATYGLAPGEYQTMLAAQNGRCKICCLPATDKKQRGDLHVDHCHTTGVVRGLLCHGCNVSIGHFKNDPRLLRAAADYLEGLSAE